MLDKTETATDVAERLGKEMGHGAFSFVGRRVEAARQRSDQAEVQFWNQIAHELAFRLDHDHSVRALKTKNALWAFMQRIEYCRHRAMKAEREAASAKASPRRRELTDLATQWRDLALHAELIAQMAEQASDREPANKAA
jgi:hypothetical protein